MASSIFLASRKLHPPHFLDHVHQQEADCPEPLAYFPRWWQGNHMSNPDLLTPHEGNVEQKECQRRVSRSSFLYPYLQGTGQLIGYSFSQGSDPHLGTSWYPHPSLPASLSSDLNQTSMRPQLLIKHWCPCFFLIDSRLRQLIFNYANLK